MAFGGEVMGESLAQTSLSSSLMVSNTFDVLCLMTLTNCGGATSVMNLAIRAFAILGASEEIMRSMGVFFFLWLWMSINLIHVWEFIGLQLSFFASTEA